MLRPLLAAALFVLSAPVAAAGSSEECNGLSILPPPEPAEAACFAESTLRELSGAVERVVGDVKDEAEAIAERPAPFVVELVIEEMCPSAYPHAEDSLQCRAIAGRPILGGAFDLCASEPRFPGSPASIPWHAVNGGDMRIQIFAANATVPLPTGADPLLENATTTAFRDTPLEGESICHDHRPTLRALAALP